MTTLNTSKTPVLFTQGTPSTEVDAFAMELQSDRGMDQVRPVQWYSVRIIDHGMAKYARKCADTLKEKGIPVTNAKLSRDLDTATFETTLEGIKVWGFDGVTDWTSHQFCTQFVISRVEQGDLESNSITTVEEQWLKLWEGFDWYYQYSDDSRVYREWSDKEKNIMNQGIPLGLSKARMLELKKSIQP